MGTIRLKIRERKRRWDRDSFTLKRDSEGVLATKKETP